MIEAVTVVNAAAIGFGIEDVQMAQVRLSLNQR